MKSMSSSSEHVIMSIVRIRNGTEIMDCRRNFDHCLFISLAAPASACETVGPAARGAGFRRDGH